LGVRSLAILKEILNLNYTYLKRKIDYSQNREKTKLRTINEANGRLILSMFENYKPVFVLSTGRCGTKFLSFLINKSPAVSSYHEPIPTLQYFNDFVFKNQKQVLVLGKMFKAARFELILNNFIKGKKYFESNQCMTFFAPVISDIFKKSKFIHIIRHPGDFARSCMLRGYYDRNKLWDIGRIKMDDKIKWKKLSRLEKVSWLYEETNNFIEDFKENIPKDRILTLKSEALFTKKVK
jgi:hypothetical protein